MASPILHIKDSYYFEVPKFMWRHHYTSLDDFGSPGNVPDFLVKGHPHATLKDFNEQLDGKILIPQPFGVQKNLYEMQKGFGISKFMILETVVALLMVLAFSRLAVRMKHGNPPKGRLWNFFEAVLMFLRDEVARPAIDSHDSHGHDSHGHEGHDGHGHGHAKHVEHDGDRFVPLLWTIFFFVLFCNLFGLVPWTGSPTAAFAVTLALASVTFLTVIVSGSIKFGPVGFWLNQVPSMDLPWYMWPLKVLIWGIEVGGMLIRHGILAVRLLANMVAGHLVLLSIMALAFSLEGAMSKSWHIAAPISVLASTLFSVLELFVAFLQAYVFTFLSALFIGAANHRH